MFKISEYLPILFAEFNAQGTNPRCSRCIHELYSLWQGEGESLIICILEAFIRMVAMVTTVKSPRADLSIMVIASTTVTIASHVS